MIEADDLFPPGWTSAPLIDLCEINPKHSKALAGGTEVSFVPMAGVDDTYGELDASEVRKLEDVRTGYTHFIDGDVLFAKITPCMENGKTAVVRGLRNGLGCGSTEFFVLRSRGAVLPDFLQRFLRQESYRNAARAAMTGAVGQARVPREFIEKTLLPVPPLSEQKRIVAKIEEMTARSRGAKEALDLVPPLLDRLRQSILAAAFRGGLTVNWRADRNVDSSAGGGTSARPIDNHPKRKKAASAKAQIESRMLAPLPQGWRWVHCSEVAEVQLGQRRAPEYEGLQKYAYIRAANITWHGLDLTDVKTMGFADPRSLTLEEGDVLLTEASGSPTEVGKPVLWRGELPDCCFQATVLRLRANKQLVLPQWLYYSCLADALLGQFIRMAPGVGILHLTSGRMREWPIALPSLEEQQRICLMLDSMLSSIRVYEIQYGQLVTLLARLDSSILASAFRGNLVQQDANDEPAQRLIERIRSIGSAATSASSDAERQRGNSHVLVGTDCDLDFPGDVMPERQATSSDDVAAALWLQGSLDKDAAVRRVAEHLRATGRLTFQRLRADGPLYADILAAIESAAKAGLLDRPKRGFVRACKPDATAYTEGDWCHILVASLGDVPVDRDDAIRAAAEWARDQCGLEFSRLREDGHIVTGLRSAINGMIRQKLVLPIDAHRIARATQTTLFDRLTATSHR